jgi:putative transposase
MGYRVDDLAVGEVYHVFSRGVEKRDIFLNNTDRWRFINLLSHCLPAGPSKSYSIYGGGRQRRIKAGEGLIDLLAYCLMDNHFHLLIQENLEGGTSLYMKRLLTSYSKYFNTRLDRAGSLFVHPFKAVLVERDEQLLHVSRYIHLNPVVAGIVEDLKDYTWSSVQDYVGLRKRSFVHGGLIRSMMTADEYKTFVCDQPDYQKSVLDVGYLLVDNDG